MSNGVAVLTLTAWCIVVGFALAVIFYGVLV